MNKIKIIIKREYLTRVRKKSFLVMTILGPLLISALWVIPIFLSQATDSQSNIIVVDGTGVKEKDAAPLFEGKLRSDKNVKIEYMNDLDKAKLLLKEGSTEAVLSITRINGMPPIKSFWYHGDNEINALAMQDIETQISTLFKDYYLKYNCGVSDSAIAFINNPKVDFYSENINTGERTFREIKMVLGVALGFMIYFFIFLFGSQVIRSVSEEKMNRIVEVLVSSIKPTQLLIGKLVGIALVGLTQFLLWIVLTFAVVTAVQNAMPERFASVQQGKITMNEQIANAEQLSEPTNDNPDIIQGLFSINYSVVIGCFLFFFITGYFLYGSLFGAVGSLIDVDTDGQQFTLPITIPLIIAMVCLPTIMNNPSGPMAFWLSIIPFTSPIIMMMRIPFGVPGWQILLSAGLMLITIWGSVWMSAKIYRTAILLYGKKITYKEIWKWLRFKN
ncbi:MAG: ABC transporter permease [Bacteroidales bacterium]|jgi:ABC-2 type transport system permease protein|nr:ABC transporter permease [Bacteroidales bacterium]